MSAANGIGLAVIESLLAFANGRTLSANQVPAARRALGDLIEGANVGRGNLTRRRSRALVARLRADLASIGGAP